MTVGQWRADVKPGKGGAVCHGADRVEVGGEITSLYPNDITVVMTAPVNAWAQ
jgi:hypothetical protein